MTFTPEELANPRQLFDRVPFIRLLDLQRVFSARGQAQLRLSPSADLGNVIGAVHGGVVFTMLDVVMASAAVSALDFRRTAVTLNISSSFLAPGRGTLTADGELQQANDDVAYCRASVTDEAGSLIAQAQGSFRYLPLPAPT